MIQDWHRIRLCLRHWLTGMAVIAGYFAFANLVCSPGSCSAVVLTGINMTGLFVIAGVGLSAAFRLTRANPLLMFTPLVAYAASSALFFGFGPMSTFVASEATRQFAAHSPYAVSGEEVLRTNLMSTFGIAVSLAVILAVLPRRPRRLADRPEISVKSVALVLLTAGLFLKHLVIMPSIYGTSDFFLPGVLRSLRYLPDLGFAMMAMIAGSGDRRWQVLFWLIWPWHFLLSFAEFSKQAVMLTLLLPALGAYLGRRSLKRLALWVAAAGLFFSFLQNVNTIGRWHVSEAKQYHLAMNAHERLDLLVNTLFSGDGIDAYLPTTKIGVESWWLRLNFAGVQAEAMAQYDGGNIGSFTQNPVIYLVPRLLWPGKPVMASPGQEFHSIVTRNSNTETKVGVTVFADGYWKMGWFGVFLFSCAMGGIFGMIARLTMAQLGKGRYLYLPAAMIGLSMGATSVTQFLQNAFIAPLPLYFGYCLVVALFYAWLRSFRVRRSFVASDNLVTRPAEWPGRA